MDTTTIVVRVGMANCVDPRSSRFARKVSFADLSHIKQPSRRGLDANGDRESRRQSCDDWSILRGREVVMQPRRPRARDGWCWWIQLQRVHNECGKLVLDRHGFRDEARDTLVDQVSLESSWGDVVDIIAEATNDAKSIVGIRSNGRKSQNANRPVNDEKQLLGESRVGPNGITGRLGGSMLERTKKLVSFLSVGIVQFGNVGDEHGEQKEQRDARNLD